MAAKKSSPKTAPAALPRKRDPNAFEVVKSEDTKSQALAKLTTTSALAAVTLKWYSGAGDDLNVADLLTEMRKAGDEVVAGDMGRVERMLAKQALTLDSVFNDMAQRSGRQDTFKGIEVLMRLALKAQAQARATAETLSVIKNPMPYIRQANIAHGHQHVVNGSKTVMYSHACGASRLLTNVKVSLATEMYARGCRTNSTDGPEAAHSAFLRPVSTRAPAVGARSR